mmetsp:Transcript_24102/g.42581  ORF Transcript_24102/g.42581 Transcript_24102/m.42581 type:complete len:103 (-) Transcript_24102:54-362(-)
MHPMWVVLLGGAALSLILYTCLSGGGDPEPSQRPGNAANASTRPYQPVVGKQAGDALASKSQEGASDKMKLKEDRMQALLENAKKRYLALHPGFVPPKEHSN